MCVPILGIAEACKIKIKHRKTKKDDRIFIKTNKI
jgi:hypothetical protein